MKNFRLNINNNAVYLIGVITPLVSIYCDWGTHSFSWFQRSGSVVVFAGILLSYRSFFRMGVEGIGGAPEEKDFFSVEETPSYKIGEKKPDKITTYCKKGTEYYHQKFLDDNAVKISVVFLLVGTALLHEPRVSLHVVA